MNTKRPKGIKIDPSRLLAKTTKSDSKVLFPKKPNGKK